MKTKKIFSLYLFFWILVLGILSVTLNACGGVTERGAVAITQNGQSTTTLGKWTWVSGDNKANQRGVYGAKGIASGTNKPGARSGSVSWIDSADNLWLFGGDNGIGIHGSLNDLWKFDGTNWIWVSGDSKINQRGVYGVKGVASGTNKPGARSGSVSWIDSAGNLWLFGGYGFAGKGFRGSLNDLWKFDGTNWTWVLGDNKIDQSGVYGSKGLAADTNKPGARHGSISWIDSTGNLWLFGGDGYDKYGAEGYLNDLWKFDGANWTWVSGDSTRSEIGVYGIQGVASDTNKPGARSGSVSWIDGSGNLWLFGGHGYANISWKGSTGNLRRRDPGAGYLNDLWKYDGTNWTWVSGDNTASYNPHVIGSDTKRPHARYGSVSWIDSTGNLWLFGGDAKLRFGRLANDLWKFDGTNWSLVSGDSEEYQRGIYGARGVAAESNIPGARCGSIGWIDSHGNLWLFGGFKSYSTRSYDYLNDLWKFEPGRFNVSIRNG